MQVLNFFIYNIERTLSPLWFCHPSFLKRKKSFGFVDYRVLYYWTTYTAFCGIARGFYKYVNKYDSDSDVFTLALQ